MNKETPMQPFIERRKNKNKEVRDFFEKAKKICDAFFNEIYSYSDCEAVEELGLDEELIGQLVEDYVVQIIKSITKFEEMIYKLQSDKDAKKPLDYTELRELAHKNLGVARNLRIKDSEELLHALMTKDDLEYLFTCIEALKNCVIKLKPECAFDVIKLLEVKRSF